MQDSTVMDEINEKKKMYKKIILCDYIEVLRYIRI